MPSTTFLKRFGRVQPILRCVEAAQEAARLVNARGWLQA